MPIPKLFFFGHLDKQLLMSYVNSEVDRHLCLVYNFSAFDRVVFSR